MIFNPGQSRQPAAGPQVAAAQNLARTTVVAFSVSIVAYILIGSLVTFSKPGEKPFPLAFYIVSVFLALGSMTLRRTQFRTLRLEVVAGLRGTEGLIRHFVRMTIISAALAEAIGLLGLIASIITGDQKHAVRLGIVGLVVALYSYPRRSAWQRTIDYFAASASEPVAKS